MDLHFHLFLLKILMLLLAVLHRNWHFPPARMPASTALYTAYWRPSLQKVSLDSAESPLYWFSVILPYGFQKRWKPVLLFLPALKVMQKASHSLPKLFFCCCCCSVYFLNNAWMMTVSSSTRILKKHKFLSQYR